MADEKKWDDIENLPLDLDYSWSESKRKFDRLDIRLLKTVFFDGVINIEVEITYDKVNIVKGLIKDLSPGGLRVCINEDILLPFDHESKVLIKFKIGAREVSSHCILRWCKKEKEGYCIGLQFLDLSPQDFDFLKSLYVTVTYR